MKARQLFPLGKAYGKAFCNRVDETKKLLGNIENGKHTFLVAPRRYGKSSLCEHTFEQSNLAWAKIDFHLVINEKDVERILINGITDLIGKALGSVEKLGQVIKKYAKKLQPKFVLGNDYMRLELALNDVSSPAENIAEALLILEKLLRDRNKQAVLLLDEFQEIVTMDQGKSIEGAIRHVAQETQQLAIIFCGSNPHLLRAMFEDERRPLYKLCRKLVLDRISVADYKPHLNKAAKEVWGKVFDPLVFERIITLTERHPYYVNYICDVLCSECDSSPTLEDVEKAWKLVVEEEWSDLLKDFSSLAHNQRSVMIHIANYGSKGLYSAEAAKKMDMPASSIHRALASLIEKDYIEKVENEYRLIVPVFKTILSLSRNVEKEN